MVISSIRPHSPSTTTTSPIRIASLKASCTPAKKFPSTLCAARPATNEIRPAEASTLAPAARADGNVSSAPEMAQSTSAATVTRRRTVTWVRMRRAWRLSATSMLYRRSAASSTTNANAPTSHARAKIRAICSPCSIATTQPARSPVPDGGGVGVVPIRRPSQTATTSSTARSGRRARAARVTASHVRRPAARTTADVTSASARARTIPTTTATTSFTTSVTSWTA